MLKKVFFLAVVLAGLAIAVAQSQPTTPACLNDRSPDRLRACAEKLRSSGQYDQAVLVMQKAVTLNPTAANWKFLSDLAILAGNDVIACDAGRKAADLYDKTDKNAATALRNGRAQYCQILSLHAIEPAKPTPGTLGKFEPANGLLLGISTFPTELPKTGELPSLGVLGGPLAVYFTYYPLRQNGSGPGVFPSKLAAAVKNAGAGLHIALEPRMPLADVNEESLIPFAQAAAEAGLPIFLRWAGEFNDRFAPWAGDPALYVEKFKLVHDIMAQYAPNVAMVWMPMQTQTDCLKDYYPGREYVDWVGISLYSVPFLNGERNRPGEAISPLEQLEKLYTCYASVHPFQVSEYAASNANTGIAGNFDDFARRKMEELYWGAALRFPRLKNINWLNLNLAEIDEVIVKADSRQNDYRLLESPVKLEVFKRILTNPYFLRAIDASAPTQAVAFPNTVNAGKPVSGAAYTRTRLPVVRVEFLLDGKKIAESTMLPHAFTLPGNLSKGAHKLEARAFAAGNKLAVSTVQAFTVK